MKSSDTDTPDSTVLHIIPEPSTASGSLRRSMHLREAKFREISAIFRTCSSIHLDETKSHKEQDPDRVKAYREEAVNLCPLLNRYQEAWPAIHYIRRYLPKRPSRHRHVEHRRFSAVSPEPQSVPPISASQGSHTKRAAVNVQTRSQKTTAPTPSIAATSSTDLPDNHLAAVPRAGKPSVKKPSSCMTAPYSLVAVLARRLEALPFERFLELLNPNIRDLHDVLVRSGISNVTQFCTIMDLPSSERELLLKHDIGLRVFDYHRVRSAMETLGMRLMGGGF